MIMGLRSDCSTPQSHRFHGSSRIKAMALIARCRGSFYGRARDGVVESMLFQLMNRNPPLGACAGDRHNRRSGPEPLVS
jgi:hypothetical protein